MAGINVKQRDITDCGAACLASVAAFHKSKLPIAKIRQWAGTDKKGTNAWGLIKAAEKMGFSGKGVKCNLEAFNEVPLPVIAHVVVKEVLQHYVVIYKVTKKYIEIMDPGDGQVHRKPFEEFEKEWSGVLILLSPNDNFRPLNEKISTTSRFIFLLKPHKSVLIQSLLGAVMFTILGLSVSIYIQKITDFVLVNGNRNLLNMLSIGMIVLLLFQVAIGSFQTRFILKTGQLIDARLILGYYKHLLKLPQRFFDTMRTGEIISRINDAVKIRVFINESLISLAVNIFIILFSFLLMFLYSSRLAMVIAIIIPVYVLIYFIVDKLNKKRERKIMENAAELESQLVESLRATKTIKQFNLEEFNSVKTETRFIRLLNNTYKSGLNSLFSSNSTLFVNRLFTIILLWFGSMLVINQEITPGELMSFYALLAYFTNPVSALIGMNKTIQNARIASDRLFEIMDLDREEEANTIELNQSHVGDIVLKDMSFSYGTRTDVFERFNMTIPHGKLSAIIGESGSGKSTIAALVQGLYPINEGQIYIGDININHVSPESLRNLVSIVPQNLDLFAGNIVENIAVGDYQPDMELILKIFTQLGMTEFIEQLPSGFNTYLGENGATISGGQKQRIAIARALYRNPEILVMDEATSNLDAESEFFVQQVIQSFLKDGKTVILIAHRLSSVVDADQIFVLQKGKLVQTGNHDKLMNEEGIYQNMWNRQFPSSVRNKILVES